MIGMNVPMFVEFLFAEEAIAMWQVQFSNCR